MHLHAQDEIASLTDRVLHFGQNPLGRPVLESPAIHRIGFRPEIDRKPHLFVLTVRKYLATVRRNGQGAVCAPNRCRRRIEPQFDFHRAETLHGVDIKIAG